MNHLEQLTQQGFSILSTLLTPEECERLLSDWDQLTRQNSHPALLRTEDGAIYGARNLLEIWPEVVTRIVTPPLRELLGEILGPSWGLVRVLFFDKPPEHSWALPWHRDLRVAVREHPQTLVEFSKPTRKYGIPHLEAPRWLLERMVTLRLHLDEVTDENGPLQVRPGSHVTDTSEVVSISSQPGDALLMRPLLSHASNHSLPGCVRHRRIFHLEFSGVRELPDSIEWHDFIDFE